MKKIILALTLLLTVSTNATCLGIYQNLVVKHNESASKNILAVMGDDYKDMAAFIYGSEHGDLYSKLMAPLAAVIISPLVLYKGIKYKTDYKFYTRLVNSLSGSIEEKEFKKLKRKIARRYNIDNEDFTKVLEDLNSNGTLCEGNRYNTVVSEEGMDFIRSRGYSSYLQVGLSARQDPDTFRELNANPLYRTVVRGSIIKVSNLKKIIRNEIEARGFEKIRRQ